MPSASNARRKPAPPEIELLDLAPDTDKLLADVLAGLLAEHKTLPSKYFYDTRGAQLFEQICELDEYYPTRTELGILQDNLRAIAVQIGPDAAVIEPGSGSGTKTRLLLDALDAPAAYVPIDVAREQLIDYADELAVDFPALTLLPVCADFTQAIELPQPIQAQANKLIYFPGSTIGNFPPAKAIELLRGWREMLGDEGQLLIGVDLKKDRSILEAAYNDSQGVTAAFNLNLLEHINRELGADFDPDQFEHFADYNPTSGAIRMWLISKVAQRVAINQTTIDFEMDEAICTEHSYKYSCAEFTALAAQAGWQSRASWLDVDELFSVQYLSAH